MAIDLDGLPDTDEFYVIDPEFDDDPIAQERDAQIRQRGWVGRWPVDDYVAQ